MIKVRGFSRLVGISAAQVIALLSNDREMIPFKKSKSSDFLRLHVHRLLMGNGGSE